MDVETTAPVVVAKNTSVAKHWCFTYNNPLEGWDAGLQQAVKDKLVEYYVIGDEVGLQNGTPHKQGYVIFKSRVSFGKLSREILPRAHLEVCAGTPIQNFNYCTKDKSYVEYGKLPGPRTEAATLKRKADYDLAVDFAKKGKIYDCPAGIIVRHLNSLKAIARDHPAVLEDLPYVCGVWIYGDPGVGKSRAARWLYPQAYPKPCNKWWDGYTGEDYVLIDDFDTNHVVLGHHLKIWADHYPFIAEKKGDSIKIRPKIICVTSNYSIQSLFNSDFVLARAISRRFFEIKL